MSSVSICIIKILTHQDVFRWQGPRKWKTFAVKSFSLFSLLMEATILKTWSRDRNYTIIKAHGRHERRHFRRVSVVCACFSRRSRLSSLGQHSRNAQNSCAKVWSQRRCQTPFDLAMSFWKILRLWSKQTAGNAFQTAKTPSAAWFWNPCWSLWYITLRYVKVGRRPLRWDTLFNASVNLA